VSLPNQQMANATESAWLAEIIIVPKDGVNDPEGEAILGGLRSLGHNSVDRVRAGRVMHLKLTAPDADNAQTAVQHMCDQLLANPVIESYTFTIAAAASDYEVTE
jgi:phosphoribosylformylglycinamidine synthase PurS subunit